MLVGTCDRAIKLHSKIFTSTFIPNNILINSRVLRIIKTSDKGESDFNYNFAGKKADRYDAAKISGTASEASQGNTF